MAKKKEACSAGWSRHIFERRRMAGGLQLFVDRLPFSPSF
jgi:hypothetical protein